VDMKARKIKLLSLKLVVNQEPEEEVLHEVTKQLCSSLDITLTQIEPDWKILMRKLSKPMA
jgi:hypothetical protein